MIAYAEKCHGFKGSKHAIYNAIKKAFYSSQQQDIIGGLERGALANAKARLMTENLEPMQLSSEVLLDLRRMKEIYVNGNSVQLPPPPVGDSKNEEQQYIHDLQKVWLEKVVTPLCVRNGIILHAQARTLYKDFFQSELDETYGKHLNAPLAESGWNLNSRNSGISITTSLTSPEKTKNIVVERALTRNDLVLQKDNRDVNVIPKEQNSFCEFTWFLTIDSEGTLKPSGIRSKLTHNSPMMTTALRYSKVGTGRHRTVSVYTKSPTPDRTLDKWCEQLWVQFPFSDYRKKYQLLLGEKISSLNNITDFKEKFTSKFNLSACNDTDNALALKYSAEQTVETAFGISKLFNAQVWTHLNRLSVFIEGKSYSKQENENGTVDLQSKLELHATALKLCTHDGELSTSLYNKICKGEIFTQADFASIPGIHGLIFNLEHDQAESYKSIEIHKLGNGNLSVKHIWLGTVAFQGNDGKVDYTSNFSLTTQAYYDRDGKLLDIRGEQVAELQKLPFRLELVNREVYQKLEGLLTGGEVIFNSELTVREPTVHHTAKASLERHNLFSAAVQHAQEDTGNNVVGASESSGGPGTTTTPSLSSQIN